MFHVALSVYYSVTPGRITDAEVSSPERGNCAGVKDFILHQAAGKSRLKKKRRKMRAIAHLLTDVCFGPGGL